MIHNLFSILCIILKSMCLMQVLVLSTLFAVLSGASAGSAVAWPGARVVSVQPTAGHTVLNTVVPTQTKVFGFSTTQYINSVSYNA